VNPLMQFIGNAPANNDMLRFIQQFNQFRSMYKGNPKEQVEHLLKSGQMSNAQFEQLKNMANQLVQMLPH
jgi:hypothetical protein